MQTCKQRIPNDVYVNVRNYFEADTHMNNVLKNLKII